MTKMFYSFDDGNLYFLTHRCNLKTLMHEQFTQNGILIYAEDGCFELVEYNGGREVEFDTRFLVRTDEGTIVFRKTHHTGDEVKTVRDILQSMDKQANDFFEFIDTMVGE